MFASIVKPICMKKHIDCNGDWHDKYHISIIVISEKCKIRNGRVGGGRVKCKKSVSKGGREGLSNVSKNRLRVYFISP